MWNRSFRRARLGLLAVAACVPALCGASTLSVLAVDGTLEMSLPSHPAQTLTVGGTPPAGAVLATGPNSRATLDLGGLSIVRLGAGASITVPELGADGHVDLTLHGGEIYVFNRRPAQTVTLRVPGGQALLEGTELHVVIEADRATLFTLLDGSLRLGSVEGSLLLTSGEEGLLEPGRPPVRQSGVEISRRIQWVLYYPAVLVPEDLPGTLGDQGELAPALEAYRAGNPVAALHALPAQRRSPSAAGAALEAALLLAAGRVDQAQLLLSGPVRGLRVETRLDEESQATLATLARNLETHIATVNLRHPSDEPAPPRTATGWLVESYRRQAEGDLPSALAAAEMATSLAPHATYAWTRRAELEFSFGRIPETRTALARGLELGPQNAQAVALDGFLYSAANDHRAAIERFDEALRLDGGLGNAWLGRGLARMALGERAAGLDDLRTAAAQEPNRALLRSYFGKALTDAGLDDKAREELRLARKLDAGDPTSWLYSALQARRDRALNTAARDVLESIARNDNRAVFRSRFLLDQDAAVRGTNLAGIFQDAGLGALAISEAGRAVEADPVSASAHRFLAGAYDALRDPLRVNLRYETAWFNERLVANLLAPIGAGSLSPLVSQGEYSRLFTGDGAGGELDLAATSRDQYRALASFNGVHGRFTWSVDVDHIQDDGSGENDDARRTEVFLSGKAALANGDELFAMAKFKEQQVGDVFLRPMGAGRDPDFRLQEDQRPLLFAAWHRPWSPTAHTLVLVSRIDSEQRLEDKRQQPDVLRPGDAGELVDFSFPFADLVKRTRTLMHGADLRHSTQVGKTWWTAGLRGQTGHLKASAAYDFELPEVTEILGDLAVSTGRERVTRESAYLYATAPAAGSLLVTGGVTWERITHPRNLRVPPYAEGTVSRAEWCPHVGLSWGTAQTVQVRAALTRVLSGFGIDDPIRLEPNAIAGFVQAYRSVIPESIAGSVPADRIDSAVIAFDRRMARDTFATLEFQHLRSGTSREIGAYSYPLSEPPGARATSTGFPERFRFRESSATLRVDRLLGQAWTLGSAFTWQSARLDTMYPGWSTPFPAEYRRSDRFDEADLLQIGARAGWQSTRGPFVRASATWWWQGRSAPERADRRELIAEIEAGWRLSREQGHIAIALLNAGDADTGFSPINYFIPPPPRRTWMLRTRLRF